MSSNSNSWLSRVSSRWGKVVDQDSLDLLKGRLEVEAFKVWLARVALQLVEEQAKVHRPKPQGDHNEPGINYVANAAKLELIVMIMAELETKSFEKRALTMKHVDSE